MMKYSKEVIISSITIFVSLVFAVRHFYWQGNLKRNGVYVLGWRTYHTTGGETGNMFRYKFSFKKKIYEIAFTDPYFHYQYSDSLLYLKVLPQNPNKVWEYLEDVKVPKCLNVIDMPAEGWPSLPKNPCNPTVSGQ